MQSYTVVVLVVATVFARVNARATSVVSGISETDIVTSRECPHVVANKTVVAVVMVKLRECINSSDDYNRRASVAHDTDAFRSVFRSACTRVPEVRTCMAAVDADARSCLGEAELNLWVTVHDFLDACITAMCADDGEAMATMFGDEIETMREEDQLRVLSCLQATDAQTKFNDNRETDLSAYTLRKYRDIMSTQQCILNVVKEAHTSANKFEKFTSPIITSMKCLTPATNEIVSCGSLEAEHVIEQ